MLRAIACWIVCWLTVGVGLVWAAPIEWTPKDQGNGHYYKLVEPDGGITWTQANATAEAKVFLGARGHLATVTSQPEWDFIVEYFPRQYTWIGLTDEAEEGRFEWVTGEPFDFSAWFSSGPKEPNNQGGQEHWVHYARRTDLGWGWNDFRDAATVWGAATHSYLVEYPVPEPSTSVLALLALTILAGRAWRKYR